MYALRSNLNGLLLEKRPSILPGAPYNTNKSWNFQSTNLLSLVSDLLEGGGGVLFSWASSVLLTVLGNTVSAQYMSVEWNEWKVGCTRRHTALPCGVWHLSPGQLVSMQSSEKFRFLGLINKKQQSQVPLFLSLSPGCFLDWTFTLLCVIPDVLNICLWFPPFLSIRFAPSPLPASS